MHPLRFALRRRVHRPHPASPYERAVYDVLGSPRRHHTDGLAIWWAHQIAWATHGAPELDEDAELVKTTARYAVPLEEVLQQRQRALTTRPVVPANRPSNPRHGPNTASG